MPVFYVHMPKDQDQAAKLKALLSGLHQQFGLEAETAVAINTADPRLEPLLRDLAAHVSYTWTAPATEPEPAPAAEAPKAKKTRAKSDKPRRPYTRRNGNGAKAEGEPAPAPAFGPGVEIVNDSDLPAGVLRHIESGHGLRGRKI